MLKQITVLGATGSIGDSTLAVIAAHPDRYQVFALSANQQVDKLSLLCEKFNPEYAVIAQENLHQDLLNRLSGKGLRTKVLSGAEAMCEIASHPGCQVVIAAVVGAAGLPATLAAVKAGKRVGLANKEALVMAGDLFIKSVRDNHAEILPVDSEHNAIFQCLPSELANSLVHAQVKTTSLRAEKSIKKLILTASGGPFRNHSYQQLQQVTPQQACAHPNWSMGAKISVDSATLMNKGLEIIEAYWLFAQDVAKLDVVIHPQSIIHSMVEFTDNSVLAQMANPDMRIPIAYALSYPERIDSGVAPLDLCAIGRLDFSTPDRQNFPCLQLAYAALDAGGSATVSLNACNEIAVAEFLAGRISFLAIAQLLEKCLEQLPIQQLNSLDDIMAADFLARKVALDNIQLFN